MATTTVAIDNAEHARAVLRLLDILDDNDDIQDVHANFDIPADVMEALED
jgi:transcriptional/translational regulatory protein YebC/TACO1